MVTAQQTKNYGSEEIRQDQERCVYYTGPYIHGSSTGSHNQSCRLIEFERRSPRLEAKPRDKRRQGDSQL